LEAIVLKCLALSPKNRYESLSELSQDLKNYLESRPIKAKPIGAIGRVGKWIRRQPILAMLTGIFSISVVTFLFLFYVDTLNDLAYNGLALQRGLKWKAAEQTYNKILRLSIPAPFTEQAREQALSGLGGIYSGVNPEKSLQYYKRALGINPKNVSTQVSIAHMYLSLNNNEEASKWYKNILATNPNDPEAISAYVRFLQQTGGTVDEVLSLLAEKCKNEKIKDSLRLTVLGVLRAAVEISKSTSYPLDSYDKIKELLILKGFDERYIESIILEDQKAKEISQSLTTRDIKKWQKLFFERAYGD
jgi:tetratricopeptide (TPR) repeat protein